MFKSAFFVIYYFVMASLALEDNIPTDTPHNLSSEWWQINQSDDRNNGEALNEHLYIRRQETDSRKLHSCYEYATFDGIGSLFQNNTFCYPSIIITGYRKCSTSALYALLSQYPGVKPAHKENCPFVGGRTLIQYFNSLPRSVGSNDMIIDGCIDIGDNLSMQRILHNPNTFYLVVVRHYADWLWSAYNYWCHPDHDEVCDPVTGWVVPGLQRRSPSLFHDLIEQASADRGEVKLPVLQDVCRTAESHFSVFIRTLWQSVGVDRTLIISSEQLDAQPAETWDILSRAVGFDKRHPKIEAFAQVRYNTNNEKGEDRVVPKESVEAGRYAASNFQPMLVETRIRLNDCWQTDCVFASLVTGYSYSACDANNILLSHGGDQDRSDSDTLKYVTLRRINVDITTSFLLRGYEKCSYQPSLRSLRQRQGRELSSAIGDNTIVKVYKVKAGHDSRKSVFYCRNLLTTI